MVGVAIGAIAIGPMNFSVLGNWTIHLKIALASSLENIIEIVENFSWESRRSRPVRHNSEWHVCYDDFSSFISCGNSSGNRDVLESVSHNLIQFKDVVKGMNRDMDKDED